MGKPRDERVLRESALGHSLQGVQRDEEKHSKEPEVICVVILEGSQESLVY